MLKFCIFSCGENHQIEMIRTKVQKEVELGVLGQGSLRRVELFVQLREKGKMLGISRKKVNMQKLRINFLKFRSWNKSKTKQC